MRERHFPRVCRCCRAPMARQEGMCWRCGTQWASEHGPRTTLQVIAGGAHVDDRPQQAVAVAARAAFDESLDRERWTNEGGRFVSAATARVR